MDRDSDVNAAMDTIADFSTQSEEQTDEPFEFKFNNDPNESEVKILKTMLAKWVKLNNFRARLWYMFRDTLKNGDAFFLRDPETQEWLWLDHFMVEMVKVDDTMGKVPEEYLIRGLDYNRQTKFGSKQADPNQYRTPYGTSNIGASRVSSVSASSGPAAFSLAGSSADPRQRHMLGPFSQEVSVVDAQHVVHLSLSIGNDINWPFGTSILEPIFKVYKQKELLEDAIIIYRVQRAPERRIFYIDTGTMPPERAKRHIEGIKNDIHQRRIPNRTGTGGSMLDAAYNPLCLSLDTRIPLLDGRTLPLSKLIEEHQAGKQNWAFSCDPMTGEIMPGMITWAGITRKHAESIRITLDNGKTIICSPDHKIPVLGIGDVEAQNLSVDDSLVAFHTRQRSVDRRTTDRTYTQVYDHARKEWVFVHRMVGEFFRKREQHQQRTFLPEHTESVKNVIHHADYNRYNNNPSNLVYMNKADHIAYHVFERQAYWDNLTDEEYERITTKIKRGLKNYYASLSEEAKTKFREISSERNKKWIAEKRVADPVGFADWRRKVGAARAKYLEQNPDEKAKLSHRLRQVCKVIQNQRFVSTQKMLSIIAEAVNKHGTNRIATAKLLNDQPNFLAEIRAANPVVDGAKSNINLEQVTPPRLDKIIADFGYRSWKDFAKKAALYNHRIVSIDKVANQDLGTITIDGQETWHNHHYFATESEIFVKNSINDDYFLAMSSDGRGSKVETLPGGECFALDTKFPLLDGRTLALTEIIQEFEAGKQLWAYSCDPKTGRTVPGIINWAGVTRKDAKVVRLTFDNGKSVTVTPDHKFPVQGRGKTEARDLRIGDSMFPHMTRKAVIKKGRTKDYTQVFDNATKKWIFVHRMVAKYFETRDLVEEVVFDDDYRDAKKTPVHHKDFNRFNNNPENLILTNWKDHYRYHSAFQTYGHLALEGHKRFFESMTDEQHAAWCDKLREISKAAFAKKSDSEKAEFIAQSIANLKNGKATDRQLWLLQHDPIWRERTSKKRGAGIANAFTPERRIANGERFRKMCAEHRDQQLADQTLVLDDEVFNAIACLVGPDTSTLRSFVKKIIASPVLELVRTKNAATKARNIKIDCFEIASRHVIKMLAERGLTWKQWRDQLLGTQKLRPARKFKTTVEMMRSVVNHFHDGIRTMDGMIDRLNADANFIIEVQKENVAVHHLARNDRIGREHLMTILQDHGYESWKQLKSNDAAFNHQVVSIEWLDETMDTGTVTIDGAEIYHDYHTVALDCCVYSMNSTGEISDLMYFTRKIARGLRVPTSYINLGEGDEGAAVTFNDGKLGAAMIQEFRFTKYCIRWQSLLAPTFDKEFKRYLIKNGVEMDWGLFELQFRPPQSFTRYRQIELDSQRVQVYQGVSENKRLAERFKLSRFLGLTEDEMIENEKLWAEENADKLKRKTGVSPADEGGADGLSAVGIRPMSDEIPPEEMPPEGEDMAPEGAGMPASGPAAGGAGMPEGGAAPAGPPIGG